MQLAKNRFCLLMLFVFSLHGTEKEGRLCHPMALLIPDIVNRQIQPHLSHQDVGHCRRAASWCSTLFMQDYLCPQASKRCCDTYACQMLSTSSYYACFKASSRFAHTGDVKNFAHVWHAYGDILERNPHLKRKYSIESRMKYYQRYYNQPQFVLRALFTQFFHLLTQCNDVSSAIIVLKGSEKNIFDLMVGFSSAEKPVILTMINQCFLKACHEMNFDLLQSLCGEQVDISSLPYVMGYSPSSFLLDLIEKKFLQCDTVDAHKRTVLHLAAKRGLDGVVQESLDAGAYVNALDGKGKTALHYAVQYIHLATVDVLLKNNEIDIRFKTKAGKTVSDYLKPTIFSSTNLEKYRKRMGIGRMLQEHEDSRRTGTGSCGEKEYRKLK